MLRWSSHVLDFEKPLVDLERILHDLRNQSAELDSAAHDKVKSIETMLAQLRHDIYSSLTPWQRIQIARHPRRPYTSDYLEMCFEEFIELHGDRRVADDPALIGGFGRIDGIRVVVLGHLKGRDTKERATRRFGMANPEGYRKALRLMQLAAKFGLPIVTFVDTAGAYPGIDAEERHIAEAIAVNLREMFALPVPIVSAVIGEGGSGGALGIAVADRVLILANAYYSVISPEGCAAILWKDGKHAEQAANALRITARDLEHLKLVDEVVPEPLEGAHADPAATAANLKSALVRNLQELQRDKPEALVRKRREKFRKMGRFTLKS